MLKKRIIPVQLLLGGRLVKTVGFGEWRDVGDPVKSSKVYNDQLADELIFLNIDRNAREIGSLLAVLEGVSEVCFMPLSVGGGISSLDDARALIKGGADKVVVNSACYENPDLIGMIAREFGSQAVVVGIDARVEDSEHELWSLWSHGGSVRRGTDLDGHLSRVVAAGAGEILIQSIDRDGTRSGFDIALLRRVAGRVEVPVIGCGGSGTYEHLREAFQRTAVEALACGSLFNFGDSNPLRAKAHLSNHGIPFKVA